LLPDVSVTIRATGRAYQVAREIMAELRRQCPRSASCPDFEPHVTLQFARDAPDPEAIVRAIEGLARRIGPFEIAFADVGALGTPWGAHVNLKPTDALVRVYVDVKAALVALGLQTYEYDATNWRPHMTLSCRHWQDGDIGATRAMLARLNASFAVDRLRVSQFDPSSERWGLVREVRLSGDARDTMAQPPAHRPTD
jgi:2'-5' RNA ligase